MLSSRAYKKSHFIKISPIIDNLKVLFKRDFNFSAAVTSRVKQPRDS